MKIRLEGNSFDYSEFAEAVATEHFGVPDPHYGRRLSRLEDGVPAEASSLSNFFPESRVRALIARHEVERRHVELGEAHSLFQIQTNIAGYAAGYLWHDEAAEHRGWPEEPMHPLGNFFDYGSLVPPVTLDMKLANAGLSRGTVGPFDNVVAKQAGRRHG